MNHLLRELAPISEAAWHEIEQQAQRALKNFLAARRLVDFSGPHGWDAAAIACGGVETAGDVPVDGVGVGLRKVQPYVELRAPFALDVSELTSIERGNPAPDLDAVIDAARRIALAEDRLVFHGLQAAGIVGIIDGSPNQPIELTDRMEEYPTRVAMAVARLRDAGVEGPYAAALGPQDYAGILETTQDGGYPLLERLRLILGGDVVYAPGVDGAVVVSMRGDDFELCSGEDLAIGYNSHDSDEIRLYIEESLTFVARGPEASVPLRQPPAKRSNPPSTVKRERKS